MCNWYHNWLQYRRKQKLDSGIDIVLTEILKISHFYIFRIIHMSITIAWQLKSKSKSNYRWGTKFKILCKLKMLVSRLTYKFNIEVEPQATDF